MTRILIHEALVCRAVPSDRRRTPEPDLRIYEVWEYKEGPTDEPTTRESQIEIYESSLFYTVDRADSNALRTIVHIFALVTGVRIDDIDIPFRNGIGRAFGQTKPTGRAFISNFHSHCSKPPKIS